MFRSTDLTPWTLIAATGFTSAVAIAMTGFSFDAASAIPPGAACILLLLLAIVYRTARPDPKLATTLTTCAVLVAFTSCAAPMSYVFASTDRPLWNDAFFAWDRSIGLNWLSYLVFVNDRPWLSTVFNAAYNSLLVQMIIAIIALGIAGKFHASRVFALTIIIAGIATIVISAFMPAMTMYANLGIHSIDYPNVDSTAAMAHVAELGAVRAGILKTISLSSAEGIIAFPSFHAALGIIFILAFWQVRWTRWAGLSLNSVMIAATPLGGGHYFADVAAGMIIAAASALLARAIEHRADSSETTAAPAHVGELGAGVA